jgi:hypothetical protein
MTFHSRPGRQHRHWPYQSAQRESGIAEACHRHVFQMVHGVPSPSRAEATLSRRVIAPFPRFRETPHAKTCCQGPLDQMLLTFDQKRGSNDGGEEHGCGKLPADAHLRGGEFQRWRREDGSGELTSSTARVTRQSRLSPLQPPGLRIPAGLTCAGRLLDDGSFDQRTSGGLVLRPSTAFSNSRISRVWRSRLRRPTRARSRPTSSSRGIARSKAGMEAVSEADAVRPSQWGPGLILPHHDRTSGCSSAWLLPVTTWRDDLEQRPAAR